MTKSLKKDFGREVKSSFARFLSILLIVALGTAFFSGIKSATPAMKSSADKTYDSENMMDICVQGTLGVTAKDIVEILKIAGVADAEGAYSGDFLCSGHDSELVTTVLSLTDRINLVKVTEGRYPEKYNECIADKLFLEKSGYQIGDTIKLTMGTDDELSDTLATDEFTIVGVGNTSYYLSDDRGTASIGNGTVDAFLVIPKEAFTLTSFTKIFVTVNGASALNCFSGKYEKLVDSVASNINTIAETRCNIRYDEFKNESGELIDKAETRFEEKKQKAMSQLKSAYQQLSDATAELNSAQAEIDSRKQEIEDAQELLELQEGSRDENKQKVEEAKKTLATLRTQYNTTSAQLDQVSGAIANMEEELRKNAGNMTTEEYADAAFQVYSYKAMAQLYQGQLAALKSGIEQAEVQIATAEQILNGSPEAIAEAREKLAQGDEAVREAQNIVSDKKEQLDAATEEYNLSKEELVAEFDSAQAKLDKYKEKIATTEVPVWYVTDREAVASFASFESDAKGINAIGTVFPIIFFLVAALVSLTTMTRMVEERRTQIGTFKALGYSKEAIVSKYVLYAFIATLAGGLLGVVLGEALIPELVVKTYKIMYVNLTKIASFVNIPYAVTAVVIAVLCTTGAALIACRRSLRENPASLMRPEAPKTGKKIFLEKFKGFWARLSFSQKAALRNLLRYKKRLYMTLFGVAGCMALLLVGFGIRDSVSSMTRNQFNKIWNYQGTITVDESLTRTERRHLLSEVQKIDGVDDYLQTFRTLTYANANGKQQNAYILVPQNVDFLSEYITLKPRVGHKQVNITDDGVIITEKLAKMLGVKEGDTISFKTEKDGNSTAETKVLAVVENYIYHYIYMTPTAYKNLFGDSAALNTLLLRSSAQDNSELSKQLLKIDGITSVTMNVDTQKQVDEAMKNLNIIVALMIISAGLLAVVVLYNLNNINITERRRELATLKVLGFYDGELERYVFRENIILTVVGMILGVIIGVVLHFFIMRSVETDTMMFGRQIKWYSYIFSIVLTVAFTILVNALMSIKLRKIDMIESLKSTE